MRDNAVEPLAIRPCSHCGGLIEWTGVHVDNPELAALMGVKPRNLRIDALECGRCRCAWYVNQDQLLKIGRSCPARRRLREEREARVTVRYYLASRGREEPDLPARILDKPLMTLTPIEQRQLWDWALREALAQQPQGSVREFIARYTGVEPKLPVELLDKPIAETTPAEQAAIRISVLQQPETGK